ncbi:MFS transporter [Actinomadura meridiana]|uniref:MFS transporter n=1 Tax=Actinomadura meridiana TaxID=559626 RepID=A0ABP8BZY9_9ACTN
MSDLDPAASRARPVREGVVLACVSLCTILVVGFVASINLAVPKLAESGLNPSSAQLLWIVDAYVVFFACLVIPAGAVGDRYGRKGVLLAGLLIFAVGAAVSAAATGVAMMLVGRAVTGVGAACVLPNGLAVLIHGTRPSRRSHAIAVWAAMTGVGGVVGNVGGGAILSAGSWRWLFVAIVLLATVCAIWAAVAAPRSERHDRDLNPRASLLLTFATLALLVGIIEGPEHGWGSAVVVGAFAASLGLFAAWAFTEMRARHPLLDPRLFRIGGLRAACLGMLVAFFGMFGLFYLNASLLQYGRGFSVFEAGLGVIPMVVAPVVASRYVPALVGRVGRPVVLGAAFVAIGAGLFGLATAIDGGYVWYAAWLVVIGVGMTLALPCLTMSIAAALPRAQAGVAGGLQSTTRELGSALGVAVIGTMATSNFIHRLPAGAHGTRTVADALAVTDPSRHGAVIDAYTAGAGAALKVVAVLVLVAGALVLTDMLWAQRRSRAATPVAEKIAEKVAK